MFCPYCGSTSTTGNTGEMMCARTGAVFSSSITRALAECFETSVRVPSARKLAFTVSDGWFCPACGCGMIVDQNDVACPRCFRHLNELIYALVELNPHPQTRL